MVVRLWVTKSNVMMLVVLVAAAGMLACGQPDADREPADLVLRGARIATVDEAFSFAEAVAVQGSKIVFVGSNDDSSAWVGETTRVVELDGQLVTPGFTDAHCHPFNLGKTEEESFTVAGSTSFAQVVDRVSEKVSTMEAGEWLIGGGWSEQDWPGKQLPIHDDLSAATPDNPVFLYRRGGNSSFVNAKALEIAGIDASTPDPYGGKIERKADGSPTGFLVNMGNNLVKDHFPEDTQPDSWYRGVYLEAARKSHEVGLTGWHDAGAYPKDIGIYKQLVDRGELTMRVNMMLQNPRLEYDETVAYFNEHKVLNYGGDDLFQVRSVKVFFDGALGSRGARFYEPYDDDPENTGVFEIRPEHLYDVVRAGLETGMQVCPHSIGTRGNGEFLDLVARGLEENPVEDHRFRSEHAQIVRAEDIPRFVELGVIPSMQPIHATSDMGFVEERIGAERARAGAYVWRSFLDAGAIIPSGSDFTVESHRPLWGYYAAVTRQDHDGNPEGGWFPEQRMTREEALRSYTVWPAYAAFQENVVGSIEVGKYADIVVLDTDILTAPAEDILSTNVIYTIVNGEIVYEGGN